MGLFQFNQNELLTFFAVLVRVSILVGTLPFFSDKTIPGITKILLSLALSLVIFPILVSNRAINVNTAENWASSTFTLAKTVGSEVVFGLIIGFAARTIFSTVQIGADITGHLMGLASASTFDPHQESHVQIVSNFQFGLAMLLFLSVNGHHMLIRAIEKSFEMVPIGGATLTNELTQNLIDITSGILQVAMQIAAPMAISIFAVYIVFGVMAKAMPQLNVLILSLGTTAVVGFVVMIIQAQNLQELTLDLMENMSVTMKNVMQTVSR